MEAGWGTGGARRARGGSAGPARAPGVGAQMFNRPGPRLVEALEWLAWFLHEVT